MRMVFEEKGRTGRKGRKGGTAQWKQRAAGCRPNWQPGWLPYGWTRGGMGKCKKENAAKAGLAAGRRGEMKNGEWRKVKG